jgi:hypothetical protein
MNNRWILLLLTSVSFGVLAQECEVDLVLAGSQQAADERAQQAVENAIKPKDVKKESCLPALDQLGGNLTMSLPNLQSISIRGIVTQIQNLACDAANAAIEATAASMSATWEAPYGLGGVGAGANTSGETGAGVEREGDIIGDFADGFLEGAESSAQNYSEDVSDRASEITNINDIRAEESTELEEVGESVWDNL